MDLNKNKISIEKGGKNYHLRWQNEEEISLSYFNSKFASTLSRRSTFYQIENIFTHEKITFRNILNLPMKSPDVKIFNELSIRKENLEFSISKIDDLFSFNSVIQLSNLNIEHTLLYENGFSNRINISGQYRNAILSYKNRNWYVEYGNFLLNLTGRTILYGIRGSDFYFESTLNEKLDVGMVVKNRVAHNFDFTIKFLTNMMKLSDCKCGFDIQLSL